MDIAKLKSYYVKPNANNYSIDFILGYKSDQNNNTEQKKSNGHTDVKVKDDITNKETEDIIDVESTEKDTVIEVQRETETGKKEYRNKCKTGVGI